jgi:hypothetical protein
MLHMSHGLRDLELCLLASTTQSSTARRSVMWPQAKRPVRMVNEKCLLASGASFRLDPALPYGPAKSLGSTDPPSCTSYFGAHQIPS